MSVFFIADTHLGHSNIFTKWKESGRYKHFSCIEEHDETIIDNWNSIVTKRDVVWLLGDAAFGALGRIQLPRLKGIKHLVLGNHDKYSLEWYQSYFNKIVGPVSFKKDFVLSHIPLHPQSVNQRFRVNIHGHIHDYTYEGPYYSVCAEQVSYTPKPWEEIREEIETNANVCVEMCSVR